jgi:2-dehydropantoate 2-reductase
MRISVFGAGAVGGHLAARLAAAGHAVSIVARGDHLAAIRQRGLVLLRGDERTEARVQASDRPAELGPQDLVISTLKANGLPSLAASIGPLLGPDTAVVFAQNGIPWWYASGLASSRPQPPDLSRLDPDGALERAVGVGRAIGAVIWSANTVIEPGVIRNGTPQSNLLVIGEPDDRATPRVVALRAALGQAGIGSPTTADIRQTIWSKLVQNLAYSTLGLLLGAGINVIEEDPALREIVDRLTGEGTAVAAAHGITIEQRPRPRSGNRHKPSILQDYERGRPLELEAMVMMPLAFARAAHVATPSLDVVAAIAAGRAVEKGLYAR